MPAALDSARSGRRSSNGIGAGDCAASAGVAAAASEDVTGDDDRDDDRDDDDKVFFTIRCATSTTPANTTTENPAGSSQLLFACRAAPLANSAEAIVLVNDDPRVNRAHPIAASAAVRARVSQIAERKTRRRRRARIGPTGRTGRAADRATVGWAAADRAAVGRAAADRAEGLRMLVLLSLGLQAIRRQSPSGWVRERLEHHRQERLAHVSREGGVPNALLDEGAPEGRSR